MKHYETFDDRALLEIVVRAICKSEGTAQCAAICLSHSSLNTTNGRCPEAMRVWGRKASAAIAAIDKVRKEGEL